MSGKFLVSLVVGAFIVAMAGASTAGDVWHDPYGTGETPGHSMSHEAGTSQMQGPVETGTMPDRGLSESEREQVGGEHARNFDPANTYPDRLWNPDPWPNPNIQAGE